MNKKELNDLLEKLKGMEHTCPDGKKYYWIPRVTNPKACPRCKCVLNYQNKKVKL